MLMTNFLAGDAGRDGAIVAHVASFGGVFLAGVVSRIEAPCGQFVGLPYGSSARRARFRRASSIAHETRAEAMGRAEALNMRQV